MIPLVGSFAKAKLIKQSLRGTFILVLRLFLQLCNFLHHFFDLKLIEVVASVIIFAVVKHLDHASYFFLLNLAVVDELSLCFHFMFVLGGKFFVDEEV